MDYLLKAKEILSSSLSIPIDQISDDDLIEQINPAIDSVNFATLVMETERFLQKEVPVTEWLELTSVHDLAAILQRNKT